MKDICYYVLCLIIGLFVSTTRTRARILVGILCLTYSSAAGGFYSASMFKRSLNVESTLMAFNLIMGSGIHFAFEGEEALWL